jgi:hypothetical protein
MNDDVDTVESRSGLVPTTVDVRSSLVRRLEKALEEELDERIARLERELEQLREQVEE